MPVFVFLLTLFLALPALADVKAARALQSILQQEPTHVVHAQVLPDGTVEILFGIDASEREQARLVDALRAHPDVRGVLPTTSPRTFCRIE